MRPYHIDLLCLLFTLSTVSAASISWNSNQAGCSASSGYIDFNTIPSFNDAAVISVNTLSFGVSISSDIKLVTLSVTKSLIQTVYVSEGGKVVFNATTATSTSLTVISNSVASLLSSQLSLSNLNLQDGILDLGNLKQFILVCSGIQVTQSAAILSSGANITWIAGGVTINGNITENAGNNHTYTINSQYGKIVTANYPMINSEPIYLWGPQSNVRFSSADYIVQGGQVILAKSVTFDRGSSLLLDQTVEEEFPMIVASTLTLSYVAYVIMNFTSFYRKDITMIHSSQLNVDISQVHIDQGVQIDFKCLNPAIVKTVNQDLTLYIDAYRPTSVNDFKMTRGSTSDSAIATFTPISDPCVSNLSYVVRDAIGNGHSIDNVVGPAPVSARLFGLPNGTYTYKLTYSYSHSPLLDLNLNGVSNSYTYTNSAGVASACLVLIFAAMTLL
ncbi:hypothetical protein PROFUN_01913 [Planoprotostelium fungivorum]|uniref:Uncharacterized protein n=1 Tax=Planoprotostelium fungivorum TaxID=1890364 RepID=A0A2P6NZ11_9EUKA|nr:hypothetical protein PROFUN_01913 [Planoprotostelium fungivorum]